ncbi:ArsR/SmtB family transcription factor [Demequina sp.]|uniref:ArsR/SmtB family transcription factor n=1 Tax=Demequina sp. TaxID=2050685 RepID=UPI003A8985EF
MAHDDNLLADSNVCTPGTPLVVPAPVTAQTVAMFKALSDPTRVLIIQILSANGWVCACDLESPLGLSQPTVSHHLKQLVSAGLVLREKRGTWAFYSVNAPQLATVAPLLTPAPAT